MVTTSMYFLAPLELYKTEKPYSLRFEPDQDGFQKTNVKLRRYNDINVTDMRGNEKEFDLFVDGFAIMHIYPTLHYDDFEDERKVIDIHLKEVADALKESTGADHVQIFEHTIRKRHAQFPIATGDKYRWNQPTATAHIDSTSVWIRELIAAMNDEPEAQRRLGQRFQCVNVWMPLKGPVRDWPLAVCHPRSISAARDVEPSDLVYPRYNIETCQLYWHPDQKWYYLSDQQPHEALVFTQSVSSAEYDLVVPHASFPLSTSELESSEPRESIETRAILFFDDDAV